ncbi:ABC transporter substrate-binding protein [Caballeronia humi]|jgi:polar amino acid transport system substrate-binding protein|uniref:Extracellular solute-binding protein n=1 Tax=Caballeronia humi TaxID=326474 RepID=A0A158J9U2_9BURK|nr:ABC transporter substrate-binding protein [Caballeronia humi]SAL65060.1 extracellular solute-binding protein [Caballeronia humi]
MKASLRLRNLLALSAVAMLFHAGAADAQTPALGKKEIVAAVVPNYPPFEFKDPETDKLTGFDIDLGEALAAKMGVKMVWSETSFDQMMSALATNRVDIILSGMTDLPDRRASVNFLDYIKSGPQFYALKTRAGDIPNMEALCGKKVGSSRRTSFPANTAAWSDEHCVKAGKPPITVVGTDGSSDARMQLRQGRLDAAVQGGETLPYQNKIDQNAYVSIGAPFMAQYTGIGMAKGNTTLNAAVTKAFEQMIADGTYQKILAKWGLQEQGVQKAVINASN